MEYKIKSLGYRTDFIFNKLDGTVEDKGDYIVTTTTSNPNYFWGNLLLFKNIPKKGDFTKWKSIFQKELTHPKIYHMTFAWDSPTGETGVIQEFIESGFKLEKSVVLTSSTAVKPPRYNESIKVQEVDLSDEKVLNECIEIQVACAHDHLPKKTFREFYTTSMNNYKSLIQNGHGKWFGAYVDGKLAGSLGLFFEGDIGRFQIVSTHPNFQRRGVCSTLVFEVSDYALKNLNSSKLVMVADEEYHAAKIYESVGFIPTEKMIGLCYWDESSL